MKLSLIAPIPTLETPLPLHSAHHFQQHTFLFLFVLTEPSQELRNSSWSHTHQH